MKKNETELSLAELSLIAGTRALLGAGLGLLLADHLTRSQRRAAGLTLLGVGLVTTIPLALEVMSNRTGKKKDDALTSPSAPLQWGNRDYEQSIIEEPTPSVH